MYVYIIVKNVLVHDVNNHLYYNSMRICEFSETSIQMSYVLTDIMPSFFLYIEKQCNFRLNCEK